MPISEAELTDHIIQWVRRNKPKDSDGKEITPDTDLLASGLVDSLGFVELMAFIESQYACRLDLTDVDPGDFFVVKELCRLALSSDH